MLVALLLPVVIGAGAVAQVPLATPIPVAPMTAPAPASSTLNNGPCMDSPRAVPLALQPPAVRSMQILRIDKVESSATSLFGETIGYLYTLQDGSTWLGQRSQDYMSAAGARAINQVLASTHLPGQPRSAFPPEMKHGVATKFQQYFKVTIPPAALGALSIELQPCVIWPSGMPLPDPKV
ncbi:MAG: hypothetical protein ABI282_02480 [Candidatus Baltobacteraceae bacterium]